MVAFISLVHLGPEVVEKISGNGEEVADSGFDLASGLAEVVPTSH